MLRIHSILVLTALRKKYVNSYFINIFDNYSSVLFVFIAVLYSV